MIAPVNHRMVCGDWLASIGRATVVFAAWFAVNTAWIHDRPEWPRFTWDDAALTSVLAGVRHLQGRHLGRVEALGFDVRAETNVAALTDEVVRSSAIEGEHLDPGEVRSSIARRLGFDTTGHLTTLKYAKLAKGSTDTALRDIRDLLARAIIVRNPGGGRSTSYRLAASP